MTRDPNSGCDLLYLILSHTTSRRIEGEGTRRLKARLAVKVRVQMHGAM